MTDIQHQSLVPFLEQAMPALKRLGQQAYPPRISDERLAQFEEELNHLPREARLRQREIIGCVAATVEDADNIILCCQQGTGKTKMALNGIQIAYHWDGTTFKGKRRPDGTFDGAQPTLVWLAPGYLVKKIAREAQIEMPGLPVLIAKRITDLQWGGNPYAIAASKRRKVAPEYTCPIEQARLIILSYTDISLTAQRTLAVNTQMMTMRNHEGNVVLASKAESGRVVNHLRALICPDCGHVLRDEENKNNLYTPTTLTPPKGQWLRCPYPKMEKVLDEKGELTDPAGNRYSRQVAIYHKGRHKGQLIPCGAPLWQYTADPAGAAMLGPVAYRDGSRPLRPFGLPVQYNLPPMFPGDDPYTITRQGPRKWALADYLVHLLGTELPGQEHLPPEERRRFTITDVIPDEVHLTKAETSARGMAAAALMTAASNSVIALTGTLTGGYAATLFYIFYRMLARMRTDFNYDDIGRWVSQYGIHAIILKSNDKQSIGLTSNRQSESKQIKEVPGLVPGALAYPFPRTVFALIEHVFPELIGLYHDFVHQTHLDDEHEMDLAIPVRDVEGYVLMRRGENGQSEPVTVMRRMTQKQWYAEISNALMTWNRQLLSYGSTRGLAVMLQTLLKAPNAPHEPVYVEDKKTGAVVVAMPALDTDYLYPKERLLAKQIVDDAKNGLRNLVYVQHNGKVDIQERIHQALKMYAREVGFDLKIANLRANRPKDSEREEWIAEQVASGIHVLITNPQCVQMGLDLIDFRRINWLQLTYSGYTLQQASRRSLRPGVEGDVHVRYWIYPGMETDACHLMARKAQAAAQFNGDLIQEALQNAVEVDTTLMVARRLMKGMQSESADSIQDLFDQSVAQEQAKARRFSEAELAARAAAKAWSAANPEFFDPNKEEDWLDLLDDSPIPGVVIQDGPDPITETVMPGSIMSWDEFRRRRLGR